MSSTMDSDACVTPKMQEPPRNAVLLNNNIFKLVETIEKKIKSGHGDKDLEELRVLREQCGSDNPLVSVTACHGLVCLVRDSYCPLSKTVSALVASLFSVKSVTGVVSALTDLLVWELQSEPSSRSQYNTKSPQHPLVSVLRRRPQAWSDVLNQVSALCCHPDPQVQSRSLELVKPVLDYILMEKNDLPDSCRSQAFSVVVSHFFDNDYMIQALACCLCWPDSQVLEAVHAVSQVAQAAVVNKHGLLASLTCLALGSLLERQLLACHSPRPVLSLLSRLAPSATNTHSTLATLLCHCVTVCPSPYLHCLLTFLVELLRRKQCAQDCAWMCVSALLPWLATNHSHLREAMLLASEVVTLASASSSSASSTATLISNAAVASLVSADPRLTQAVNVARLSESLCGDAAGTLQWLQGLGQVELGSVHLYVSALLIGRPELEVRLAALGVLTQSRVQTTGSHTLTVLLYQLARERATDNLLALLRALPATATDKSNVLGVVSTLEAVRRSGSPSLALLAVDLYCQLWLSQERCFPQLMDILAEDCSRHSEPWLAYTLQANVCKTVCEAKPELHGKEMVSKVSEILNKCGGVKEAVASALALQALTPLCSHDVVDVFTIWRSLAPRFSRDKRPPVLISLCELVSVASVQKSGGAETDNTLHQMLGWLWSLMASNKQPAVVDSALRALSKFRVDQMSLKMLPECFRRDLKLPAEMVKTPADAARKPEDVLDYIPGECWVQVLSHVKSEAACLAVASWIKMEVTQFRGSSLYQVDRAEPSSYSHLPHRSVVRGVTSSLQQLSATAADSPTALATAQLCISALVQPTPKPLPSLSWVFLEQLPDSTVDDVTRLTAKQSPISPSARRLTEAYIKASGDQKEKIKFLYSILIDLCRGIPPVVLRPFLERTLTSALAEKDDEQLAALLGHVKTALKEEKIHDANRTLLHQQVKALWDLLDSQHPVFRDYCWCVSELPVSVVESMTSTSLMWEVTPAQLQKAFRLRTFMALVPNIPQPLNWLNEIIDGANSNISEQFLALELVGEVLSRLWRHPSAWPWLQELMGQTHLASVSNKSGVEFLVAVFMLSVDIMSGYSSLAPGDKDDSRVLRFPQAVASLVRKHGEETAMLEWLSHMLSVESFPPPLGPHFQQAVRNISLLNS